MEIPRADKFIKKIKIHKARLVKKPDGYSSALLYFSVPITLTLMYTRYIRENCREVSPKRRFDYSGLWRETGLHRALKELNRKENKGNKNLVERVLNQLEGDVFFKTLSVYPKRVLIKAEEIHDD